MAHCFVAVFVHTHRLEFSVEVAEGKSSFNSFIKDDHIVKPGWSFTKATRRETLGRVLKYANAIVESRRQLGMPVTFDSYNDETGTRHDGVMANWETLHNNQRNLTLSQTPRPEWWPTFTNLTYNLPRKGPTRDEVAEEGFDIDELIKCVRDKHRRRKRTIRGKLTRRVGRFTVYAKDPKDAPY